MLLALAIDMLLALAIDAEGLRPFPSGSSKPTTLAKSSRPAKSAKTGAAALILTRRDDMDRRGIPSLHAPHAETGR